MTSMKTKRYAIAAPTSMGAAHHPGKPDECAEQQFILYAGHQRRI